MGCLNPSIVPAESGRNDCVAHVKKYGLGGLGEIITRERSTLQVFYRLYQVLLQFDFLPLQFACMLGCQMPKPPMNRNAR